MAFIECVGAGGGNSDITLYATQYMTTGSNVVYEYDCHKNDIIVIYNFSYTANDGYATPLEGCETIDDFYCGYTNQKHPISILKATSDHIKFKIVDSYIAGHFCIFTKNGEAMSVSVTKIGESSSVISTKTVNISSLKNNVIVYPYIESSSSNTNISVTNLNIIADEVTNGKHIKSYRSTSDEGSTMVITGFYVGSYILIS